MVHDSLCFCAASRIKSTEKVRRWKVMKQPASGLSWIMSCNVWNKTGKIFGSAYNKSLPMTTFGGFTVIWNGTWSPHLNGKKVIVSNSAGVRLRDAELAALSRTKSSMSVMKTLLALSIAATEPHKPSPDPSSNTVWFRIKSGFSIR